jgi:predicted Fe-Mo cluster-binding NifX family protein
MKIAIASEGENLEGVVSERAGRASFYLFFEGKKFLKSVKNPFAFGSGGAGFAVAKMLSDEKVDIVVAGSFGGNMESALKERGVKFEEFSGSISEAIIKFS